ncbi:unnamed protein product [Prorocentrum cordatum]|uniref:WSC domain-containing protein n=1 Tax=Prorocentrum cordatum TaxID=2364126 RepID=A0ABN9RWP0_9DINO|nr:unnamed protein product [Polarella glacialis]
MVDGTFGEGDCDIAVGKAGNEEEGDVDVAVAWIPYAAGFLSGYVAAPETPQHAVSTVAGTWEDSDSHSSDFESGWSVTWVFGHEMYGDHAVVSGRGGLGRYEDGMLFAIATDSGRSNNKLNTVGVRPMDDPPGWRVKVHEDNDPSSGHSALPEESMFAFVVVPFVGTIRLHAAWVNGMTGVPYRSTGNMKVMRTGVGTFLLQVGRKGEKDGVLLLQTAGGNASSISCAFLSYEWNELRRAFEVQARHVSTGGPGEERFLLVDVDFYALWMDHKSPPVSVAAKLDQPPSWAGCFLHKLDQMFDLDDCVDSPLGWRDKLEKPCTDYAELEYCTRSGGYGSGWLPQMGDFSNWSGQGHDASTACCACGGGSSMKRAKYMGKDFSVTTCVDACEGFTYAAVQSGQCRCGDFLPDEATRLKDSECGTACPFEGAEPSLQCGADGRNAVYRTNFVMLEYLLRGGGL